MLECSQLDPIGQNFLMKIVNLVSRRCNGGPSGVSSGSLEPPFETKLFHFHGEFSENDEKLIKSQVKLTNDPPL